MYLAKATRARIALRCEPLHTATQPILPDGIGIDVHAEPD
jgi:hypothetical protein